MTKSARERLDGAADVLAACRRIARAQLDDERTGAERADYWKASGAANYDETWRHRLKLILRVIEEGEADLPRVLSAVARRVEEARGDEAGPVNAVALDTRVRLPREGLGYLHRGVVTRLVTRLCTRDTDGVVELGSGWGEHLCHVWLSGGPLDAPYYACELSETGRKCALVLGALEPRLRLTAPYFNYVSPRLSLPVHRSVVVYSVHSVEQVEHVAPDLIERLCAIADDVAGAHVEPIGWQIVPRAEWNDLTREHARRCSRKRYNDNFWPLLERAEADGLITIDRAEPNALGLAHNPASIVSWRKRKR